jgi:hypothetical protein
MRPLIVARRIHPLWLGVAAVVLAGLAGSLFWRANESHATTEPDPVIPAYAAIAKIEDRLVMVGGLYDGHVLDQIITSEDGITWETAPSGDVVGHRTFLSAAPLGDELLLFGGFRRLPPSNVLGDVLASADGVAWTYRAVDAAWESREDYGVARVDDGIILFGGVTYFRPDKGANYRALADVWRTTDGFHWSRIAKAAPWGKRRGFGVASLGGRVYLMGGYDSANHLFNDVWSTADGEHWTLETASAPWSPRGSTAAIAHDGYIWLMGGITSASPREVSNAVWRSRDGRVWEHVAGAPWPARGGAQAAIIPRGDAQQLAIYGGLDAHQYYSDGWVLDGGTWAEIPVQIGPAD